MWALRHAEESARVPITRGWEDARAVLVLWGAAAVIAAVHVIPRDVVSIVGVSAIHGGLMVIALTWGGVDLARAGVAIVLVAAARACVLIHPLGAVAYLAIPIWLGGLVLAGRLRGLGLMSPWPWGAVAIGGLAGSALALHLVTCAARTLGYGLRFEASVFIQGFGYDLGANVLSAELFFRGALLQHLWRRWHFGLALAVATAAATLRYCVDPFVANPELRVGAAVYMAVLALLNGALYRWSGSLLPGLAAASVFFACYRLVAID
jgi:CAAX prenyl protease-like protein